MTPEQQRKMLEAAAKACGVELIGFAGVGCWQGEEDEWGYQTSNFDRWNPLTNPADTAEMCALLGINTTYWWGSREVECQCFYVKEYTEFFNCRVHEKDHDNSRLTAWMYAATMVAAKIGGYEE